MKTPISYYGGKQTLAAKIVALLPKHNLYCEPFIGGAAVFFSKPPSAVEVINDTNKELINFYRVIQNDFVSLEKEIRITLHSRDLHRKAKVIYDNPDMFPEIKRAWAVWVLANQSFSSMLDGAWGYDIKKAAMPKKLHNKKESFTEDYAIRLQNVSIECTDALRIIRSRDTAQSFFYCDPPYYNSDMGHYDGYTLEDYTALLETLAGIEGKFMLSSYESPILKEYTAANGWNTAKFQMKVSVANNASVKKPKKIKTEVITYNYSL
jgi:DNA adenine methylase